MDMADEAVPFHELLVGGRSVSGVRPDAARRVGLVEKSIAQTAALIGSGVCRAPFANEAETAIERDVVLIAEDRNRQIDRRRRSILARLGLGVFDCPARVPEHTAKLTDIFLCGQPYAVPAAALAAREEAVKPKRFSP